MKKCQHCGKSISEYALSCPFCGGEINLGSENNIETTYRGTGIKNNLISVAATTICAIGVSLLWMYISAIFLSKICGSDWMKAFLTVGSIALKRSIIFLVIGAIAFFFIKQKCKKKLFKIIITTIVLSVIHFICLIILEPRSEIDEWLYSLALTFIPCISIGYGLGSSVLQGLCSLVSDSTNNSKNIAYIAIISAAYLFSGLCASAFIFVNVRNPHEIMLFSAIIATIVAVLIAIILRLIKGKSR